jgi:HSP20 family protein
VRWEPFREMEDSFCRFRPRIAAGTGGPMSEWRPDANISTLKTEFLIEADLPDVKKEDVKITVRNGMLDIAG